MPAKEIKALRQSGKLEEAYEMAKAELEADLTNLWGKRNLSWVLYSQLDESATNLDTFLLKLKEVKELDLPESEDMFFDNISIVISKAIRSITSEKDFDVNKIHRLFDEIKEIPIKRNSKWHSVLFSAFHKGMKESNRYIEFADWWDFSNFRPEDYVKETLSNGKQVMALVEQGFIAYSKHLLPKQNQLGEVNFDKNKVASFLPVISKIVDDYPQMQYPGYFKVKLLLAIGDNENILETLLPFAKKKRGEFWVWEILAEALSNDPDKVFSCYCKALTCMSPEEMLVGIRQKMARLLIDRQQFNEAKTEIELLVQSRNSNNYKIPFEVEIWMATDWYKSAISSNSNLSFYKTHTAIADAILFEDIKEETVIVEFVNNDKKILNFIASEHKYGFFKYDRFFKTINIGDTLKVRFQNGSSTGLHQVITATQFIDANFKAQYLREIKGIIKISEGKSFGFIENAFIHPSLVQKYNLVNGQEFTGQILKSFNKEKNTWGWKLI